MDTFRNAIQWVLVAATTTFVASVPLAAVADESIFKRMVGVMSPRGEGGPVTRLHRRIEERPSHRNDYQDGLVVHAGGAYAGQLDSLEGHGRHASGCRGGHCDDHCVVRPDRFGYYETRWRQWPGTRVVQTAGVEALTPASPPRLELPSEKEESLDPQAAVEFGVEEPVEESDATTLPGLGPAMPPPRSRPVPPQPVPPTRRPAPEPMQETELDRDAPEPGVESKATKERAALPPEEEPEQRPEPKPEAKQPAAPSADDNLFDEAAHRRRLQERLAVIRSEARAASVVPEAFPATDWASPVPESESFSREPAPVGAAPPVPTTDVRPTAYERVETACERKEAAAEGNPLRTSRDRGWRARIVDEPRPIVGE